VRRLRNDANDTGHLSAQRLGGVIDPRTLVDVAGTPQWASADRPRLLPCASRCRNYQPPG
jgi:hypothetical protein